MQTRKYFGYIFICLTTVAVYASDRQSKLAAELKSSSDLPTEAYTIKAKQIIERTQKVGHLPSVIRDYLSAHASAFDQLKNGTLDRKIMLRGLDRGWVNIIIGDRVDSNPYPKLISEFVDASNVLMAHRARRMLKCYVGQLEAFEKGYAADMEQVSSQTFTQKTNTISASKIEEMLIEEASKLANTSLSILDAAEGKSCI